MATIKRDLTDYSEDETFSVLMNELGWLAGMWHETHDKKHIQRYHIIYRALKEMGCEDALDFELLLPFELMPPDWYARYLEIQESKKKVSS